MSIAGILVPPSNLADVSANIGITTGGGNYSKGK